MCGFEEGDQDNWLITQYISTVVNGTRLPQVRVLLEYELTDCIGVLCQRTFDLLVYETSTEDNTMARNTSNYRPAMTFAPQDVAMQNSTANVDLTGNADGFYLALRDQTTCVLVSRVLVFYNVCPGGTVDLVMRPETLAPRFETGTVLSSSVAAECVEGARPENGEGAQLECFQGGTWFPVPGSGCVCGEGFSAAEDGTACEGKLHNALNNV